MWVGNKYNCSEGSNIDHSIIFEAIVNTSSDGICFTDKNGELFYMSENAMKILGYSEINQIDRITIFDLFNKEDISALKDKIDRTISGTKTESEKEKEFRMIKQDSSCIYVNLNSSVVRNKQDEIEFICFAFKNITNLKIGEFIDKSREMTEEGLKASLETIRNLSLTKDKLFSIIAHDLKGPIGNSALILDILIDDEDISEREKDEIIINLRDSTKRIYNLLMNLLDWSRSQKGELIYRPEKIKMKNVINECMELLGSVAASKYITLNWDKMCEKQVLADEQMLNTVIRNLVSNAIKYTRENGKIEIVVIECEDKMEIYIEDNGVGIKPEKIDLLFKADPSPSTEGTNGEIGTGLGLLLCKEFVELNKGKIWVESQLGAGSKFIFTLPKA